MVVRTYVARVGHFPGLDTLSVDQHVKKKRTCWTSAFINVATMVRYINTK